LFGFADELVVYVKREFQQRGYNSLHFASLPKDMTDGSRELLLAFGWLLGSEKILDRFMISCTALLDDDTVAMHLVCITYTFST
jgi:Tubulin epsilon and delta complex protein 1